MPPRHARPTAPPIQDTAPLPTAAELLAENANLRNRIVELEARQAAPSGSHASGAEADPSGTLLHKAVDGFVLLDTEARILDANEAYCRMVGYTRGELLTMTVPGMEASETPEDIRRRIREIVETGAGRFEAR
ncbi:MAG: PAS domain S-box protein, partial [Zetaproteobacteria bacterium]